MGSKIRHSSSKERTHASFNRDFSRTEAESTARTGPGFLPLRACLGFSSFELAFVRRNNDTANIMYCPAFAGALRNKTGREPETPGGGRRGEAGSVGGQTVKNRGERNNGVVFAKNNRYIS